MSSDEALLKETGSPRAEAAGENLPAESEAAAEAAAPASQEGDAPPAPPRRRVRLNPIIADESLARPRPSLGFSEAAAAQSSEADPPATLEAAPPVEAAPPAEAAPSTEAAPSETGPPAVPPPAEAATEVPSAPARTGAGAPAEQGAGQDVTAVEPIQGEREGGKPDDGDTAGPAPAALPEGEPAPRGAATVAIPAADELGADLEAEIAAAMSGAALSPAAETPAADSAEVVAPRPTEEELEPGTRLKGAVQTVGTDNVFLELGYRSPGVVPMRQFEADKSVTPEVGRELEVIVDRVDLGEGLIHVNLPRGKRKVSGNWDAVAAGQIADCMVTKTNKGGLEVTLGSLRGFMPASQVDLGFVPDLETFVGQKLTVQIVEANPRKRNLVVSRRAVLMIERKDAEENLWKTLEVGQSYTGRVKTIKDYGAFVDIGGIDGFLHVSEVSWNRIRHPSDVLSAGQEVEVQVIGLDAEKKKISLGMKQLTPDPWSLAADRYPAGATVSGKVTRTTDFGAFVELEEGVEGLVHISELDHRRVKRVTEVLKVGQEVDAKVLEVAPDRKRISLSLKALKEAPAEEKKSDEDLAPGAGQPHERKRKEPLKGGTTGGAGRGLFGDPRDFS